MTIFLLSRFQVIDNRLPVSQYRHDYDYLIKFWGCLGLRLQNCIFKKHVLTSFFKIMLFLNNTSRADNHFSQTLFSNFSCFRGEYLIMTFAISKKI